MFLEYCEWMTRWKGVLGIQTVLNLSKRVRKDLIALFSRAMLHSPTHKDSYWLFYYENVPWKWAFLIKLYFLIPLFVHRGYIQDNRGWEVREVDSFPQLASMCALSFQLGWCAPLGVPLHCTVLRICFSNTLTIIWSLSRDLTLKNYSIVCHVHEGG